MNWLIELFLALLFTGITGSALLFFWYAIGRLMDKWGHVDILYRLLQMIPMFFLIPVLYMIMRFYAKRDGSTTSLFTPTPDIVVALEFAARVWLVGFCIMVGCVIWQHARFRWNNRCWLENDRKLLDFLDDYKHLLGIQKNIAIRQCYGIDIPMVGGVIRPVIWLPIERFTDEELKVILVHELIHVKNSDCLIRIMSIITRIIHWFNPLAWIPYILINRWGEYSCDYKACEILGDSERYFKVIIKMACKKSKISTALFMPLFETDSQIIRRMKRMARYKKIKKKRPVLAGVVACVMLMASTMTIFATADAVMTGYDNVYDDTVIEIEEVTQAKKEYVEYTENVTASEIRVEEDLTSVLTKGGIATIEWSVGNNVLKRTSEFYVSSGDTVSVMFDVEPSNKTVKVGLITSSGTKRYVTGSGFIGHDFEINASGTYRVFVENTSGVTVDVFGSYRVK